MRFWRCGIVAGILCAFACGQALFSGHLALAQTNSTPKVAVSSATPGISTNTAPTITRILAHYGNAGGGQQVPVIGSGFVVGSKVIFGETDATHVTFYDDKDMLSIAPPHNAGTVDVVVVNPDGKKSNAMPFLYIADTPTPTPVTIHPLLPTQTPTLLPTVHIETMAALAHFTFVPDSIQAEIADQSSGTPSSSTAFLVAGVLCIFIVAILVMWRLRRKK